MATPIFEFAVCFAIGASNHFLCELMTDMPETFASRMEVADLGSILVSSSRLEMLHPTQELEPPTKRGRSSRWCRN